MVRIILLWLLLMSAKYHAVTYSWSNYLLVSQDCVAVVILRSSVFACSSLYILKHTCSSVRDSSCTRLMTCSSPACPSRCAQHRAVDPGRSTAPAESCRWSLPAQSCCSAWTRSPLQTSPTSWRRTMANWHSFYPTVSNWHYCHAGTCESIASMWSFWSVICYQEDHSVWTIAAAQELYWYSQCFCVMQQILSWFVQGHLGRIIEVNSSGAIR